MLNNLIKQIRILEDLHKDVYYSVELGEWERQNQLHDIQQRLLVLRQAVIDLVEGSTEPGVA